MRRKAAPPPLVAVRGDYDAALAAVLQAANMLASAVDAALKLDQVAPAVAPGLRELAAAYHAAWIGEP